MKNMNCSECKKENPEGQLVTLANGKDRLCVSCRDDMERRTVMVHEFNGYRVKAYRYYPGYGFQDFEEYGYDVGSLDYVKSISWKQTDGGLGLFHVQMDEGYHSISGWTTWSHDDTTQNKKKFNKVIDQLMLEPAMPANVKLWLFVGPDSKDLSLGIVLVMKKEHMETIDNLLKERYNVTLPDMKDYLS